MPLLKVIVLAIVQGLAELLPVSSSAHVVVAEKLMGLDPSAPDMTLLLVMLHTGTMFAVIAYFWSRWRTRYFSSAAAFKWIGARIVFATILTGIIGEALVKVIEKTLFRGHPHAEIEDLFSRLDLIAPALAVVGVLILIAGLSKKGGRGNGQIADAAGTHVSESRHGAPGSSIGLETGSQAGLTMRQSGWIGAVQGLCLPFRGFSRSGATISTGMLVGVGKERAEEFSFALAVVLTPPVIVREVLRLMKAEHLSRGASLASAMVPSLLGAIFAFLADLLALKWLSRWLEGGRWYLFGIYCLVAAGVVEYLFRIGY